MRQGRLIHTVRRIEGAFDMPSAAERAYEEIRRSIASGAYEAGDRLREEELSTALGVSRTPIREALRRLSAEGFVTFSSNKGAQVAAWTDTELEEIFELRALLESYAAKRAATRVDTATVRRLESLALGIRELVPQGWDALGQIAELNNEFHQLVLTSSESPQLVTLAQAIVQIPLVHRTFRRYTPADLQRSAAQHVELVDACRVGDAGWAEAVMRSHILSARHIFDGLPAGGNGHAARQPLT